MPAGLFIFQTVAGLQLGLNVPYVALYNFVGGDHGVVPHLALVDSIIDAGDQQVQVDGGTQLVFCLQILAGILLPVQVEGAPSCTRLWRDVPSAAATGYSRRLVYTSVLYWKSRSFWSLVIFR